MGADYILCVDDYCWLEDAPGSCDSSTVYRTYDGSCNNLQHRNWGRSIQPLERLIDPVFDAGTSKNLCACYPCYKNYISTTNIIALISTYSMLEDGLHAFNVYSQKFSTNTFDQPLS